MSDSRSITVKVLGRDYQVACPPDERDALYAAARYLDDRMQSIRKRAAGLGLERIAIMTGLNMARELMQYERGQTPPADAKPITPARRPAGLAQSGATTDGDRISQLSLTIREALSED
ncbi:MAG: cell division protein ZapA [Oceanococcaceae bacterium]